MLETDTKCKIQTKHSLSTGNNQIITNVPRRACTSSHTSTKDTEDGLLTSGVGDEEIDLVPCWRRDRSWKKGLVSDLEIRLVRINIPKSKSAWRGC